MTWQDILMIVVPLATLMGWGYKRIDKKFDSVDKRFDSVDKKFDSVDKRFDSVMGELREMRKDIQSLDSRVSRIEGFLAGPTHWEPRIIEKKEEQQ